MSKVVWPEEACANSNLSFLVGGLGKTIALSQQWWDSTHHLDSDGGPVRWELKMKINRMLATFFDLFLLGIRIPMASQSLVFKDSLVHPRLQTWLGNGRPHKRFLIDNDIWLSPQRHSSHFTYSCPVEWRTLLWLTSTGRSSRLKRQEELLSLSCLPLFLLLSRLVLSAEGLESVLRCSGQSICACEEECLVTTLTREYGSCWCTFFDAWICLMSLSLRVQPLPECHP